MKIGLRVKALSALRAWAGSSLVTSRTTTLVSTASMAVLDSASNGLLHLGQRPGGPAVTGASQHLFGRGSFERFDRSEQDSVLDLFDHKFSAGFPVAIPAHRLGQHHLALGRQPCLFHAVVVFDAS